MREKASGPRRRGGKTPRLAGSRGVTEAIAAVGEVFARARSRKEFLDALAELLRDLTGCRCVGIRCLDDERNIPFESYVGYSREFCEEECWLSLDCDRCACIRVMAEEPAPPDVPLMTPGGSFRCDNTARFVAGLSESERALFRGTCARAGFASVAIVPFRHGGRVRGVVHLADERETAAPLPVVEFLESLSPIVGAGIVGFAVEEAEQREAEVTALLQLSRVLLEAGEFQDAAQSLFESAKRVIGATSGYIALTSPDGTRNEVIYLDTGGAACTVDLTLPMPIRGMRGEVQRTRRALYHNDFASSEWPQLLPPGHMALDNVLMAPLVLGGGVVGLFGLGNKPGGFTRRDVRLASSLTEHAAAALYKSHILEELRASEARFRSVAESAVDAIISTDSCGGVIFWNQAAETLFGRTAQEMVGKPITLIMPERSRRIHEEDTQHYLETGQRPMVGRMVELAGLRADGSEFPCELSLAQWKVGEADYFAAIIRDITERKRIQGELREHRDHLEQLVGERTAELVGAEQRYRELVEGVDAIVWEADAQTWRFTFVSKQAEEILGYPVSQWLNEPNFWADHLHPEDRERVVSTCLTATQQLRNHDFECRMIASDCTPVWLRDIVTIESEGGKPVRLKGLMLDITEQKQAEQTILLYTDIVNNMQIGVHVWHLEDPNDPGTLRFVLSNPAAERFAGLPRAELLGRTLDERYPRVLASRWPGMLAEVALSREARDLGDIPYSDERVPESVFSVKAFPLPDQCVGMAFENITRRKRAEDALRDSLHNLQRTLQGVVEALAAAAEIRDPYTAGHQRRVADLACAIASRMRLPEEQIEGIHVVALLHDIGKLYVPAEILNRPGRVTETEMALIRSHAQVGYEILKEVDFPWPVASIALQHHERLDGSGYPAGLSGDQILPEARILAVADVVEAMSSHRPYRPALGIEKALEEISKNRGVLYDAAVVDACFHLFTSEGFTLEP